MTTPSYRVAVLGLGAMGLPMATRLATELTVHGFDIAEPRLALAADAGITPFDSARGAVAGVDAVLLAVRNGAQLRDVLFGANGVAVIVFRSFLLFLPVLFLSCLVILSSHFTDDEETEERSDQSGSTGCVEQEEQ